VQALRGHSTNLNGWDSIGLSGWDSIGLTG